MRFALVKQPEKLSYYGHIPNVPAQSDETSEVFYLNAEDWPLLNTDFVDAINDACGTLLDNGDIDYFDKGQCEILRAWLIERMSRPCSPRLTTLYEQLMAYASAAVAQGTGVVIEF